ncbi:MAG: hypothetical protein ACF8PN_00600 [Phycisphaerales bacterium]
MRLVRFVAGAIVLVLLSPSGQAAPRVEERSANGEARMRYFLMNSRAEDAAAPAAGYKLLLVLPGGGGGADFRPFVERIAANALPSDEYLLAQLVAPVWSEEQSRNLVWPTAANLPQEAEFTTESFIDTVIDDIRGDYPLDENHIFTLSWSSSGPAGYSASLREDTPITGSFVAMSVFKPDQLPPLDRADGQHYYILHSPQDFIGMRFPEAARDDLAAHGATTTLMTYEGGHGWKGDVYGMIRRGVEWLDERVH